MRKNIFLGVLCNLLLVGGLTGLGIRANAQTPVESSMETRLQLDFQVPAAALAAYLPAGWTSAPATEGPAKDCNLRVIFIDRMAVRGADGNIVGTTGSNRLVYLVAPVKDAKGAAAQLVINGLTEDAANAPGPFGNYEAATTHMMQRTTTSGAGPLTESQDWKFASATGDTIEMHIKFEKGPGVKPSTTEVKYYSAKTPSFYQISKEERALDILENTTTNPPNRVKSFSFKATGKSYAKLFDGTQKTLSWDNMIWFNRTVSLP